MASGNGIGPNLFHVVGRRIASLPGPLRIFVRHASKGRKVDQTAAGHVSDRAKSGLPGEDMEFAGDANVADRAAITGYLGTFR